MLRNDHRSFWLPIVLAAASIHGFVACGGDDDESPAGSTDGGSGGQGAMAPGLDAGAGASSGAGGSTEPRKEIRPEWLTCETAADCVIVQEKVCSACATTPVNVAHEAELRDVYETATGCVPGPPAPCAPIVAATPTCTNGECDMIVDCEIMEMSQLCGELAKCSVLTGTPCHKGDGGGEDIVRVGCEPRVTELVAERTCAEDPDTGQQLVFLSNQTPAGWTPCDLSACDP